MCSSTLSARRWRFLLLSLCVPCGSARAEEVLIDSASRGWKYVDSRQGPDESWRSTKFDDSTWQDGHGMLGYGDQDVQTPLSYGSDPQDKHRAAFFRKRFAIRNRPRFKKLFGRLTCDDGAVVYVNQREVYRFNLPPGNATSTTLAIQAVGPDPREERAVHGFLVDPELVVDGTNTIAVSVHQANPTSSDLAMQLEFSGLETDEEVASVTERLEAEKRSGETAQTDSAAAGPVIRLRMPTQ